MISNPSQVSSIHLHERRRRGGSGTPRNPFTSRVCWSRGSRTRVDISDTDTAAYALINHSFPFLSLAWIGLEKISPSSFFHSHRSFASSLSPPPPTALDERTITLGLPLLYPPHLIACSFAQAYTSYAIFSTWLLLAVSR